MGKELEKSNKLFRFFRKALDRFSKTKSF
jgi:hypothetical protein